LLLAVVRFRAITGSIERLGSELRGPACALDREQDLIKEVEDGRVEVLLVALLFPPGSEVGIPADGASLCDGCASRTREFIAWNSRVDNIY
jgi:hypothetical protein